MAFDKKRWIILAILCLINLSVGSLYAWSVFAGPLASNLNEITGTSYTAGDLSIVFTIANAIAPIILISGGYVNDRLGPKWVVFTGGLIFGAGMALTGVVTSVGAMIFTYGIMEGIGMGFVYGNVVSTSVKYFPDKRGLIGGLTVATYGLGSVVIPPIAGALISGIGIAHTMQIIGACTAVIVCVCALFLEKCPADYKPQGWKPLVSQQSASGADKNWRDMLQTPIFYIMIALLTSGGFMGLMIISQASSIAQKMIGMSVGAATASVSLLALFNTAGRVLCGYVSDKIGRINCLAGVLVLAAVSLLTLYSSGIGDNGIFICCVCAIGFSFGAFMGIFPGFTADVFGAKHNSVNYGIMFVGFGAAGILGPVIMNKIFNATGSYQPAFLVAAFIAVAGFALSFLYRFFAARMFKNNLSKN